MAKSRNDAKLVIVDTDVGVDDACALLLLLGKYERPVNLLAITTVRGNVGVDQVCSNVLRTLLVTDRLDVSIIIIALLFSSRIIASNLFFCGFTPAFRDDRIYGRECERLMEQTISHTSKAKHGVFV